VRRGRDGVAKRGELLLTASAICVTVNAGDIGKVSSLTPRRAKIAAKAVPVISAIQLSTASASCSTMVSPAVVGAAHGTAGAG
jgi:hypothetical protein